jgi:hypothetical protein
MDGADAGHLPEHPADAVHGQHTPMLASLSMPPAVHSGSMAQSLPQDELPSPGRSGQASARSTQSEPAQAPAESADGRWAHCMRIAESVSSLLQDAGAYQLVVRCGAGKRLLALHSMRMRRETVKRGMRSRQICCWMPACAHSA